MESNPPERIAILDANVLLEFKDFQEIDWPNLLRCKRVCLILTYPVLGELDKWKRATGRRRDRALSVVRRLAKLTQDFKFEEVEDRPGVTMMIWREDAKVDAFPPSLSKDSNDDRLLAIALQITSRFPGQTRLITDDSIAQAKGKALGLEILSMPEDLRLPAEPTPESKELARLRSEVDALKSVAPRLGLFLMTASGPVNEVSVLLRIPRSPSDEDFKTRLKPIEEHYARIIAELHGSPLPSRDSLSLTLQRLGRLAFGRQPTPDEIQEFEREASAYPKAYREYLQALHDWNKVIGGTVPMRFVVENDGHRAAKRIMVVLHFPDELIVLPKRPQKPKPPEPPIDPRRITIPHYPGLTGDWMAPVLRTPLVPRPWDPSTPRIRKGNSTQVEYGPRDLMHGFVWKLEAIGVTFPGGMGTSDFEIPFSIHAENLPNPSEGTIKVAVERMVVEPWPNGDSEPEGDNEGTGDIDDSEE